MESDLLNENAHPNNIQFTSLREPSPLPLENSSKPAPITISSTSSHMEFNNIRPEPYGASYTSKNILYRNRYIL